MARDLIEATPEHLIGDKAYERTELKVDLRADRKEMKRSSIAPYCDGRTTSWALCSSHGYCLNEVFSEDNFIALITIQKTSGQTSVFIPGVQDFVLMYARRFDVCKHRSLFYQKPAISNPGERYVCVETASGEIIDLTVGQKSGQSILPDGRILRLQDTTSQTGTETSRFTFDFQGVLCTPSGKRGWSFSSDLFFGVRLRRSGRLFLVGKSLRWKNYHEESGYSQRANNWTDLSPSGFGEDRIYVVQTLTDIVERCVLMSTDPGDLVLDPTCGSGTTAYVAEQWGRRWITIDTSRVAMALSRARIMGARYPFYLLADSAEGQRKERELGGKGLSKAPTHGDVHGDVRQGFVYERARRITLKSIANNAEIDVIWERWQETLEPLREDLNAKLDCDWEEWEVPREASEDWSAEAAETHRRWREARIARQQEIDDSIAAKADYEYLYDKPYEDNKKVRVAGPFTVESLSPHRVLAVDENDELLDRAAESSPDYGPQHDFAGMVLEQLTTAGVQQAHKDDRVAFAAVTPWPGEYICAEGRYVEGGRDSAPEKRAGIFVGPEFGTVSRPDLVVAAREAGDAGFDVLIACAFNYEAHASEFNRLGRIPVLKARMNADLHMAGELKNTGKGNLFVIFGEPDIDILQAGGEGAESTLLQVKINGVDVFHPNTGEVRSDGADGIACWFIDTDYNEESFFVRHAYFLGANDPYKALKTTLKAEVDADAWSTLHSDISRPFDRPESGRIAVKVINHLGDEVMKVFRV